ncbi:hypothetical protein [Salinibacter ruber]|uniref:hypothetical protein n=1 Tax=Salinibacter ruber TaxID=146919 RepID=UPI0020735F29|nr:hypothetical protein [Salinibacter ruber]
MPDLSEDLKAYGTGLFSAWGTIFFVVALASTAGVLYSRLEGANLLPVWVYILLLLFSFTAANFLLFRKTREKIPGPASISIKSTDTNSSVKARKKGAIDKARIRVNFHFANEGERKGRLWLELESLDLGTNIFENTSVKYKDESTGYHRSLDFPIEVDGGSFYELECIFTLSAKIRKGEELAENLFKSEGYELEYEYTFDDVSNSKVSEKVHVKGGYDRIKDDCLRNAGEGYLKHLVRLHSGRETT